MDITRPSIKENEDEILKLRAKLSEQKNKLLCIVINFLATGQPTRVTDLMETINKYYRKNYDKSTIYYTIKKLYFFDVINFESYMEATKENGEVHKKIVKKHQHYLHSKIPKNFWDRYHPTKYYYLTKKGELLIEWTCKILGFEMKNETKKKEEIENV